MSYPNTYRVPLKVAAGSSDTTIYVASAAGFGDAPFNITIDSEILNVTAKIGTTWTVTRGTQGSSAAAHAKGALVTNSMTVADVPGGGGGVTSFNTRTGAVTLTQADVTTALGDANIAYTDVANTFTKQQTITTAGTIASGLTNNLSPTGTLASAEPIGLYGLTTFNATRAPGPSNCSGNAVRGDMVTTGGDATNYNRLIGTRGFTDHLGTGTVSFMRGGQFSSANDSSGTITQAMGAGFFVTCNSGTITTGYGVYVQNTQNAGTFTNSYGIYIDQATGTIANNYGLYITDQSGVGGTISRNLYSAGATATNEFAGNVIVGSTLTVNTIVSTAGTALSASATAPTAAGTTTAGANATLAASNATAGTVTAGAAVGGNAVINAGNAARLTSGNAAGGNVILTPGTGIGTGAAGYMAVEQPGGTPGTTEVQIYHDGTNAFFRNAKDGNTAHAVKLDNTGNLSVSKLVVTAAEIDFTNSSTRTTNPAPGVIGLAGTANGWLQNTGARARMTADVTESAAALTSLSDLSLTLIAGRKYTGRMVIKCVDSVAAEGVQFDFNGGSATVTNFWAGAGVLASGGSDVVGSNISTALNGVINFTTFTGESVIIFEMSMVCNAGGTFIPRAAQNTHAAGTATFRLGSYLWLEDSPN